MMGYAKDDTLIACVIFVTFLALVNCQTSTPSDTPTNSSDTNSTGDADTEPSTTDVWTLSHPFTPTSPRTPSTTGAQPPTITALKLQTTTASSSTENATSADDDEGASNSTWPTTAYITGTVSNSSYDDEGDSNSTWPTTADITATVFSSSGPGSSDTALGPGPIAGIVVGSLLLLLLVAAGVALLWRRSSVKTQPRQSASTRSTSFIRGQLKEKGNDRVPLTALNSPVSESKLVNPYAEFAEANMTFGGMTWDWPQLDPVIPRSSTNTSLMDKSGFSTTSTHL